MAEFKIEDDVECEICGRRDEGVLITKRGGWTNLWTSIKVSVCEGCISKIFRSFSPDK